MLQEWSISTDLAELRKTETEREGVRAERRGWSHDRMLSPRSPADQWALCARSWPRSPTTSQPVSSCSFVLLLPGLAMPLKLPSCLAVKVTPSYCRVDRGLDCAITREWRRLQDRATRAILGHTGGGRRGVYSMGWQK